jgi:hypothetical protein
MGFNTKKMQTSGGTPRKGVFPRSTFLSLDDTPDSYVSQAGLVCVVKNDEKQIEFKAVGVIDDHLVLVINTDTTPGTLVNKLTAGENVTFTTNNPTGNATITIAAPNVVKLQSATPGTPQTGHINVLGTVVGGALKAMDPVSTNYTAVVYNDAGSGELLSGGLIVTYGGCNLSIFPACGIAGYKLLLVYYSAADSAYRSALEYENPTSPVSFATMRLMKSGGTIISGADCIEIKHEIYETINAYLSGSDWKRTATGYSARTTYAGATFVTQTCESGNAGSVITWLNAMQYSTLTGETEYFGNMPWVRMTSTQTAYADGDKQVCFMAAGSKGGTPILTQNMGKILFSHHGVENDYASRMEIVLNYGGGDSLAATLTWGGLLTIALVRAQGASIGNTVPSSGAVLNVGDNGSTTLGCFLNKEASNADGSRVCVLAFRGINVTTPVEHCQGAIRWCHDGTGNDQRSQVILSVNSGSDGDGYTDVFKVKHNGAVYIPYLKDFGVVGSECEAVYFNWTTKEIGFGYQV